MLPRQHSEPSLAAWLCSYNPKARVDSLERTLAGDDDLLLALEALRVRVGTTGHDGHAELDEGRRKIETLRSSLNSLTAHMTHLTDRLAASEAALASATRQTERTSAQHAEELHAAHTNAANRIASLTADLAVRRDELSNLYASLDSLLPLRGNGAVIASTAVSAGPPDTAAPGRMVHDDETLKLEEEVRALEEEIARLDGSGGRGEQDNASTLSVAPTNGSAQDGAEEGLAEQQARNVIKELERQLVVTEMRLREVENERSQLRRLLEDHAAGLARNVPATELAERVQRAEAERDRLAALLATSEEESQSLQAQLAATHQSLDTLSARVRLVRNGVDIIQSVERQKIVQKTAQEGQLA
ncbi:hypothetical protein BJY59DRAFT_711894 [Rhodotorula toruloides]